MHVWPPPREVPSQQTPHKKIGRTWTLSMPTNLLIHPRCLHKYQHPTPKELNVRCTKVKNHNMVLPYN
eukprot:15365673-Ditylum_brightwellii.AAC.2